MRDQQTIIATDIPAPAAKPERAPIEIDPDLTRRDVWLFVPLIAAAIALPLIAVGIVGLSAWQTARQEISSSKPPVSFASRWPEKEMPVVTR